MKFVITLFNNFQKAYKMKKIIISVLIFICFLFISKAEERPKLEILIFANETTCWSCLKSVNSFSKVKLDNLQLEITLYYCSDNREQLSRMMEEYELSCETIIDPECLYAKKYNLTRIPAIVIKDKEKDSIVLSDNWNDPKLYLNVIVDYDKYHSNINRKSNYELNYLSLPKTIVDFNGKPLSLLFCQIVYHSKKKEYYGFIQDNEKTLSILDSNGQLIENINLQNYQEFDIPRIQGSPYFMNDSLLVWRSNPHNKLGDLIIYGLNINTRKIEKKGIIDASHTTSNSTINNYNIIPKSNKLVFTKYFFDNDKLEGNEKLLLLTDTNYNAVKYFGCIDPVCTSTTMAANKMTSFITPAVNNDKIYYLMSLSNKLFVFDIEGNYINTIELEFEEDYYPPFRNIPKKLTMDERFELWSNYKMIVNVFIKEDMIVVIGLNTINNKETLKIEQYYYITLFDNSGKRIASTFRLPKNVKNAGQIIGNKLLVIEHRDNNTMAIRWLDIDMIIGNNK